MSAPYYLNDLGWTEEWQARCEAALAQASSGKGTEHGRASLEAGRVVAEHYGGLEIVLPDTKVLGRATGLLRREIASHAHPRLAVGDFVLVRARRHEKTATIEAMVERRSVLQRRMPGNDELPQPVCANLDEALIIVSADEPPNIRRLERFLSLCHAGEVKPRLILTKSDLVSNLPEILAAYRGTISNISAVCAPQQQGIAELGKTFLPQKTYAFVGPSGVGKTTLANAFLGERTMLTGAVKEDGKGRHTTTHRQLVRAENGALFIDTPGLREIGMTQDSAVDDAFSEIAEAARFCRFSDCRHDNEPDCAIKAGLKDGSLTQVRVEAWQRLSDELYGGGGRRPDRQRKR